MTAVVKYCVICGKPFTPQGRRISCTPECAKIRAAQKGQEWEWHHSGRRLEGKAAGKCVVCGRPLRPPKLAFCSCDCEAAYNAKDKKEMTYLREEYAREAAERAAREARLAARDAAYAAEYPNLATGEKRGRLCGCGCGLIN